MLETGLPERNFRPRSRRKSHGPLRILWAGELQPWKGLSLLIKALSRLPSDVPYGLRVLGKGPQKARWQRLARRTGVEQHTDWLGWFPNWQDVLQQFSQVDVFAFTSLRDTSGNVVLEAFGVGLPVVCLDHQGVHDMVTDQCGVKVPVTTPQGVIDGLTEAITTLARDRELRHRLGQGAIERAKDYLWPRQGERMEAIYRRVLQGQQNAEVTS